MKTNCIVCDKEIENWDIAYPEDKPQVHPIDGTQFRTYGHYGSTVFDPMDASYLEIVICDDCLRDRKERTYSGVNEAYRKEIEKRRADMDKLIDEMNLIDLDRHEE